MRAAKCAPTASHRYRTSNYPLYGFLTTEPNGVVAPIHPKAMPVILTTHEENDVWMRASRDESDKLLSAGHFTNSNVRLKDFWPVRAATVIIRVWRT
jgi:putative SOS response-associated peptidase YedK